MPAMLAHPTRGRDQTINMRVLPRVRELIDQAAEASGKTRSDFVLDAARRAAEAFLLDRRVFVLDEEAHRQFVELLDAPPRRSEELRKLLATKAPWDK